MKHLCLLMMIVLGGLWTSLMQAEIVEERRPPPKVSETEVSVEYGDEDSDVAEEEFTAGASRLTNGGRNGFNFNFSAGTALINNSIESVMELLFYNLLDQSFYLQLNDHSRFGFGIGREVFPVSSGAYVVVDRFSVGPEYSKKIGEFHNLPVSVGVDGKLNLLDIYYRTDGMRLAEQEELPAWRSLIANFFGTLPILSAILPPSFNPNEMYDPLNLLGTPYSFPLTIGGLRAMPISSIRSYQITGGVNLPVEFASRFPQSLRKAVERSDQLKMSIGPSLFVGGEYRINVLRRSKNIVWVGLTRVKRGGGRFAANVGRSLYLLDKLLLTHWWRGLPAKIFPLDAEWTKAKANIFNQIYEYDLRHPMARMAYLAAVKGDFVPSMDMHQRQFKGEGDTGVSFHFTMDEDATESSKRVDNGVLVFSREFESNRSFSEIRITDDRGVFYVLKNNADTTDSFTDALTGRQRVIHDHDVEMKVIKVKDPDGTDGSMVYKFDPDDKDPLKLELTMRIFDRYTDAHEYKIYMRRLRTFADLPLASSPSIELREKKLIDHRYLKTYLSRPRNDRLHVHVTPTYLGRFEANARILFTGRMLETIQSRSKEEVRRSFARSYEVLDEGSGEKDILKDLGRWMIYGIAKPFELINLRWPEYDFISDAERALDALDELAHAETPLGKMAAFDKLLNTNYPDRLARALLELSSKAEVPRVVSFDTSARGPASPDVKQKFDSLRNKIFRSTSVTPIFDRSRVPLEKLKAFVPGEIRESRVRPVFKRIDVKKRRLDTDELNQAVSRLPDGLKHQEFEISQRSYVVCRVSLRNLSAESPSRIYLKISDSGKVQLGKFLVGERIFKVYPAREQDQIGAVTFEFFIDGPLSVLDEVIDGLTFEDGNAYQVDLSSSADGRVWSEERGVRFTYFDHGLAPAP